MRRGDLCLLAFGMVLLSVPLHAQIVQAPDSLADSTSIARPVPFKDPSPGSVDSLSAFSPSKKSPGTAMILSAVLPGAGQFYNESYWKVPIVLGLELYFVSSWLDNNRRVEDYRQQYQESLLTDPAGDSRLLNLREFYKDQRDTFMWYIVILYFINVADAYVDASLHDFNVGGNLSLRLLPPASGPRLQGAQLSLRLGF